MLPRMPHPFSLHATPTSDPPTTTLWRRGSPGTCKGGHHGGSAAGHECWGQQVRVAGQRHVIENLDLSRLKDMQWQRHRLKSSTSCRTGP
ncbi:hypothetical protein O3P69_005445 [Scylla paramamosain]|uniref:Uncharacterized protein n=1 Tax=Scylla paramamosain TaxID=85552 RepID=A0AAW0U9Y8_SCYPA